LPYQKKEPFPTKKKPEGQYSKKEAQRPTGEGSDFFSDKRLCDGRFVGNFAVGRRSADATLRAIGCSNRADEGRGLAERGGHLNPILPSTNLGVGVSNPFCTRQTKKSSELLAIIDVSLKNSNKSYELLQNLLF